MQHKSDLQKEQKALNDSAAEKDLLLQKKLKTIGNFVHDSVPVETNEVSGPTSDIGWKREAKEVRISMRFKEIGLQKVSKSKSVNASHITKSSHD